MNNKEIKIEIPDGYRLVQISENQWELRKIEREPLKTWELPKTWEEFCRTYPIQRGECHIDLFTDIINEIEIRERDKYFDRKNISDRKTAEAFLALMQLIQLMNYYNDGWKPDWKDKHEKKYIIMVCRDEVELFRTENVNHVLAFKTEELRNQFLKNFRDLIEIAKPLI